MQAGVSLGVSGYVQTVDHERLCKLAAKEDLLIELNIRTRHLILRTGNHIKLLLNASLRDGIAVDIRKAIVVARSEHPPRIWNTRSANS